MQHSLRIAFYVFLMTALAGGYLTSPADAKIYKWKDNSGKTHFTDSPSKVPAQYRNQIHFTPKLKPTPKKPEKETIETSHTPQAVPEHTSDRENVHIDYNYYEIAGKQAMSLRRQMSQLGPIYKVNGHRFDGMTQWGIEWQNSYRRKGGQCLEFNVILKEKITYTMPKWIDRASAPSALRKKWDRYYKALDLHERGHGQHGLEALQEMESAIPQPRGGLSCAQLQDAFKIKVDAILEKYKKKEIKYDKDTQHGLTQGAVFP